MVLADSNVLHDFDVWIKHQHVSAEGRALPIAVQVFFIVLVGAASKFLAQLLEVGLVLLLAAKGFGKLKQYLLPDFVLLQIHT